MFHLQPRAFRYLGHKGAVARVRFSPSGDLVASAAADRTIRLWVPQVRAGSTVIKAHQAGVRDVAFFASGNRMVSCADDKTVKLWCIATQKVLGTMVEHKNWVCSGPHSRSGSLIPCFQRGARLFSRSERVMGLFSCPVNVPMPDLVCHVFNFHFSAVFFCGGLMTSSHGRTANLNHSITKEMADQRRFTPDNNHSTTPSCQFGALSDTPHNVYAS